jgi:outer membrane protein TolC
MSSHPVLSKIALAAALGWLGGCASPPSTPPLSPATSAERFDARSLQDEGLRQFLAANLGSAPATDWDFEALCWTAFYYNPSLELARAQWATARAAERTAGVRPNPTLTLTPGYNTTHIPGVSPWMPGINLDFLFPTAGKRGHQQEIARNETEAALLAVFSAGWQLRSDLRRGLIDAAFAQRREACARSQVELQQKLVTLLEGRFAAGSTSATDVSTVRTALLRAQAAAADAGSQAAAARGHVATALGLPLTALTGVNLPLPPAPPALSPQATATVRRESLQSRADILAALAKYRSAQAALELEFAKRVPDFHLGPGYQWDQGNNKWTLGISFELPVFNHNEAPIAEAVARRAEAAAQFNVIQTQAIAAIDDAIATQAATARQLERMQQLRLEIESQFARTQQRLELGRADQVEIQTARLDLAAVESSVIDAENAVAITGGQLEDTLQIPFPHLATLAEPPPAKSRTP